jgi:hypothetical protein
MDVQTLGIVVGVVAVVAIVLYVWDRRTRQKPIDWTDAAKIALGAGGISGGVAYTFGGPETIAEITEKVTTVAQDMFVGKPDF